MSQEQIISGTFICMRDLLDLLTLHLRTLKCVEKKYSILRDLSIRMKLKKIINKNVTCLELSWEMAQIIIN